MPFRITMMLMIPLLAAATATGPCAFVAHPLPPVVASLWKQGSGIAKTVGPAPPHTLVELMVFVKQQRIEQLKDHLLLTSDPESPRYGDHLSQLQVQKLTRPTEEHLKTVKAWLHSADLSQTQASPNHDIIKTRVTVADAEKLLNTKYGPPTVMRARACAHARAHDM